MIKKKTSDKYNVFLQGDKYNVFLQFFLIFKLTLIYLFHILFVLKIKGMFGKRKSQFKRTERGYFLYM